MCGVIGFVTNSYNKFHSELLKEIFRQSQIRGKHATGISFYNGHDLVNVSEPIPSSKFIKYFDFNLIPKTAKVIGHCRYSTSDLDYNQPLSSKVSSLVHNGVITQEFPYKWEDRYGYKCETKNDSELLLRCLDHKDNPFEKFNGASIAAIYLDDKEFMFFRNGRRPLWFSVGKDFILIASTLNIIERSYYKFNIGGCDIKKCEAGVFYKVDGFMNIKEIKVHEEEEKQLKLNSPNYYIKVDV